MKEKSSHNKGHLVVATSVKSSPEITEALFARLLGIDVEGGLNQILPRHISVKNVQIASSPVAYDLIRVTIELDVTIDECAEVSNQIQAETEVLIVIRKALAYYAVPVGMPCLLTTYTLLVQLRF